VAVTIGALGALGVFVDGAAGSISYVAALSTSALVVLLVAGRRLSGRSPFTLVGVGLLLWAFAGVAATLGDDLEVTSVPEIVPDLLYAGGYLPVLGGLAGMFVLADHRPRSRRLSSVADGFILFLTLYAVLWLLVVEKFAYSTTTMPRLDRAFQAIYPAGDLAMMVLAARIVVSRALATAAGWLLLVASAGCAVSDIAILVSYLRAPEGSSPIWVNLCYLWALCLVAVAVVVDNDRVDRPVGVGGAGSRLLALAVAASALLPPAVMGLMAARGHEEVALGPVAVWLFLLALAVVVRAIAATRDLDRAHRRAAWLAAHDLDTDLLRRSPFLHEVAEGGMRDRSGTVIVVELEGVGAIGDHLGLDVAERVTAEVAERIRVATGDGAVASRLATEQFAVFLRSTALARGRQVAGILQMLLAEPMEVGEQRLAIDFAIGVAQADGAVIDVPAGVRRATEAMRHARRLGPGRLSVDADLTGTVLASTAQSTAGTRTVPLTSS
jgi:diguanylate cyclase (GGDEF)-like protein